MPSEKEKKQNGEPFDPRDSELVAEHRRAKRLTRQYNQTTEDEEDRRQELLHELFGAVDDTTRVYPPFRCDYGYNIHVGKYAFMNTDCVILDACRVDIGQNCMIGPGVHIYTVTHPLNANERVNGPEYGRPVTIGANVWICGRAILNPGVAVGDGSVIASGAVVTEDVPGGCVVQGNPAEVVKEIDED